MLPNVKTETPSTPPASSSGGSPAPVSPSGPDHLPDKSKRTLTRRGHFKSRLGCFNCKRRRIKCNEVRPQCSQCHRLGLECVYPAVGSGSGPTALMGPQAPLSILTIEDLRLFHQFMTGGLPTLPLRGGKLWQDIAAMSHTNECLAHAILGLGGSHLSQVEDKYAVQALRHRTVTIRLFNEQLSREPDTPMSADILFATIGCLFTQAALLPNNMVEYMTLLRIADYVVRNVTPKFPTSLFHAFTPEGHIETLMSMVSEQPMDWAVIDGFRDSVISLEAVCRKDTENAYRETMLKCINALYVSATDACKEYVLLHIAPALFTNEEFFDFLHPKNVVGPILTIHSLLLDYLLGHCCIAPEFQPKMSGRKDTIISWARTLAKNLPIGCQQYMKWPLHYCDILAKQDARYLLNP